MILVENPTGRWKKRAFNNKTRYKIKVYGFKEKIFLKHRIINHP